MAGITPLRWPAEALWEAVEPLLPGFSVEVLPSIDSTNSELMRRARAGLSEPTLLVAEEQTAGRGRLGRIWHSDAPAAPSSGGAAGAGCLTMSLGLPLAPRDWSGLSLAVGLCVAEALQPRMPGAGGAWVGLKWPNDLWLGGPGGDRKLGGILVETASWVAPQGSDGPAALSAPAAAARFVVVGIGLNVLPRSAEGLSLPAGSLQELQAGLDAPSALLRIVPPLVRTLQSFVQTGFGPLQPGFAQRDVLRGRAVALSDGTQGMAQGVAEDGALLVLTAQGLRSVTSAEISVRPQATSGR